MGENNYDNNTNLKEGFLATHIVPKHKILAKGLRLANYTEQQIGWCGEITSQYRFNTKFDAFADVMCTIYEDLQKSYT